jgi:hypothetical protein
MTPPPPKIWQTAFSKDFGSMTQGDYKTGQKGTNSIDDLRGNKKDPKTQIVTYARVVVDF